MELTAEKLRRILTLPGHISPEQFDAAAEESKKKCIPLMRLLPENGLIPDEYLGKAVADAFDYHFIDISKTEIPEEFLGLLPEPAARAQEAIIFDHGDGVLKLATSHPDNYEFIKLLEKKAGCPVSAYYATPLGIEEGLKHYRSNIGMEMRRLLSLLAAEGDHGNEEHIVTLVNLLLEYAHTSRASDIHIEPVEHEVSIRYRIDGILHEIVSYPKSIHDKVVFRIKIMSRLRTDEHAAAQDGRFEFLADGVTVDVRVSILPVTGGENIVLRILSDKMRRLSLAELGLEGDDLRKVEEAFQKPYGMILAAGPTGSGKTTTLYAILQILNRPEVNIMTIEDPVEYGIERVQQIQVNSKKNLTFAQGLRSIVRQDPDIIMVGEIRDNETADIAVNAAMTGHLMLSTLHSNDAATTFPRLMDMGIEPFLVASSVNVVIAQRLVRKICEKCRMSYSLNTEESGLIRGDVEIMRLVSGIAQKSDILKITFFKGAGCRACGKTGYAGRTGIFEVMEVTDEIRPLIANKGVSGDISAKAKEIGMTSMIEDGLRKVFRGITTIEEVIRATKS